MPQLTWLGDAEARRAARKVPYRILDPVETIGDPASDNLLIQGDNLEALKALLPFYACRVKCIFIDPPYNTKSAFDHYDDNLEHSQWLSMMYPRLELLRDLLSNDGSIWVTIDENEAHYLKVIMDEIFHRRHFIGEIIWQKRTSRENRAALSSSHDTLLLYSQLPADEWKHHRNKLPPSGKGYGNPDGDRRGEWKSIPFSAQGWRPNQMYTITAPDGTPHNPPRGRCWSATKPEYEKLKSDNRIYFPKGGKGKPRVKQFPWEEEGLVPMTIWPASEVGDNQDSKREILTLFDDEDPFTTPKPEALLRRVVQIATNPGDLVLDSYLGSGTTAAVAHKLGRRWIGIEMGDHARTHCVPRLKKVIDGEQGGISDAVGWKGGGGFRFMQLGIRAFLENGRVNPAIRFNALASYIWFLETRHPADRKRFAAPVLGANAGVGYALLYNGILGDKRPESGNVLTNAVWGDLRTSLPKDIRETVIYGEACRLSDARLKQLNITFKQIPYDVGIR